LSVCERPLADIPEGMDEEEDRKLAEQGNTDAKLYVPDDLEEEENTDDAPAQGEAPREGGGEAA
jgi:hypothetical protein